MKYNDADKLTPRHIGIIMDGNGRWATARRLPRGVGHKAGVNNIPDVVSAAFDHGVKCVTLYAFSTENDARPKSEVEGLIDLIRKRLKSMTRQLISDGARIVFSGDESYFPDDVQAIMNEIRAENVNPDSNTVNIALYYSGRAEIINAARQAAASGTIDAESFERHLYTHGLPDLDMIIRTGGQKRLSNFLLYQAAYSELFFTDTLWPDFSAEELDSLIDEFMHRTRNFGKVK